MVWKPSKIVSLNPEGGLIQDPPPSGFFLLKEISDFPSQKEDGRGIINP